MSTKEYNDLCERVYKIDRDAAEYMRKEAIKLKNFEYFGFLIMSFRFEDTPQGFEYWNNISIKLGE